ncbi:MAG: ATP-dependent Clp protease ATP-binding subunit [Prevotella sp.]|nr:ATP-dependent Clp protease ATP-binding subunit [Prevotella sp.]
MHNKYSENITSLIDEGRREARRHRSTTVRPEHLLMALLKQRDTVADRIMRQLNISKTDVTIDCESHLKQDEVAAANSDIQTEELTAESSDTYPALDEKTNQLMRLAALEARMDRKDTVGLEHLLLAILHDVNNNQARSILEHNNMNYGNVSRCLARGIAPSDTDGYNTTLTTADSTEDDITAGGGKELQTPEASMSLSDDDDDETTESQSNSEQSSSKTARRTDGSGARQTPVIDAFAIDLTATAAEGKMDPVVGREKEIMRLQEILCRRKKNNPILIGEPGVGKSAIVEGLAQMIASHRTSPVLFGKRLVSLDMASMVAGTKYRGQFEERIKNLIKELEQNPDIIIFIDEIHTIIGAGSAAGSMDAANMLKPALARGAVQCIGATTLDEYRKTIEKDGALERRFQKIIVEPSTPEETIQILENLKERYERHHHVSYTDDAINACVKLTQRYITDRAFPDKAIDAMDEVGAHIHLRHADVPEDITKLETEIREAKRKKLLAVHNQDFELAANCRDLQIRLEEELSTLNNRWQQGDTGNRETVSADDVADVVARMTGIPVQRMAESEGERLRGMAAKLKNSVIAQDNAIEKMVRAIQRNRIGLHDPNHPIGVFMFLGPTGVGKTYLAKKLAEEMFGTSDAMIRIDMSEYSESFNTSRLVGAPPGYVGYEEGGQLTEKVRRKPYSIVLLDEIEKANGKVFNMLLQVLDEGRMTDGNGRLIDFRNTIIIMTSNAGTRQLKDFARGVGFTAASGSGKDMNEKDREYARSIIQKSLSKQFAPEFLNRLDEIITFDQLNLEAIRKIVDIELAALYRRVADLGYTLTVTEETKEKLAKEGYDIQYGARPLKRAIQTHIEDVLCERILSGEAEQGTEITI